MTNIEKIKSNAIKILTLPVRIGIGIFRSVKKCTPDTIELPFEFRKKENYDNRKAE